MENKPKKNKDSEGISISNYIGIALLLVCYFGAIWNVFNIVRNETFSGKTTIRLCHWQLETGIRSAIQEMITRFEAENPDVKIEQIPITERAYAQWVTTQLIGRTAPDIIEVGMFDTRTYLGRYFQPMTDIITKPNPYNKDNELKDVPWKDTFLDGMQSSYISELVEYYTVPLSQFTIRLFFNKDMFLDILGKDSPPSNLDELFSDCEKIKLFVDSYNKKIEEYNKTSGAETKEKLVLSPISSSNYQVNLFKPRYASALSSDRVLDLDYDFDGEAFDFEILNAHLTGALSLDDKKYKVSREIVKDIAKYFPLGFMSVDRMDAGFAFVQGRAAMITSGSWDANSYIKQINDQPFGDIILSIDGKSVLDSDSASRSLMMAAERDDNKKVKVKINREGREMVLVAEPLKLKNASLLESYGLKLKDRLNDLGVKVPTVVFVESASPASDAGFKKRMRFEVGIFDFPMPDKADPKYGEFYSGKVAEVVSLGFPLGITKFSKNQDLAIKFLQFCTTPKNNEELNKIAQWIPAIKGAAPSGMLKTFIPDYKGYWGYLGFTVGTGRGAMKESQIYWPYISSEPGYDYDKYISILKETLPSETAYDYERVLSGLEESIPDKNLRRSSSLAAYVFMDDSDPGKKAKAEKKLAAGWDILAYTAIKPVLVKSLISPEIEKDSNLDFHRKFKKTYKSFSKE